MFKRRLATSAHACPSRSRAVKPACSKSPVVGKRLGDVPVLHHEEAGAVREAPCLVGPGCVALHGAPELRVRLLDDLHIRAGFQITDHVYSEAPKVVTPHATRS